jgi:FkbM family methyltransferase
MIPDFAGELELLLSESIATIDRRQRKHFNRAAAPYTQIALYGAGNLGRKLIRQIRQNGRDICCLTDNNQSLWGSEVEGTEVLSPSVAAGRFGSSAAFVVSIWNYAHSFANTRSYLRLLGCQRILPVHALMCGPGEGLLPHYSLDWPSTLLAAAADVRKGLEVWADDQSKAHYVSTVRARLEMNPALLPLPLDHYPPDVLAPSADEVFVDCGAYDGDTIVDFIRRRSGRFQQIVGIEPDPGNFDRLKAAVAGLAPDLRPRVKLVNAAAAEARCTAQFVATGTMASALATQSPAMAETTVAVECAPLDELLDSVAPTLVKVDIEGAELSLLKGARSLISRAKTAWAVTTEHRLEDLWALPLYFRSLSGEYDLFLRPHGYEAWDLVCYAVPRGRAPILQAQS